MKKLLFVFIGFISGLTLHSQTEIIKTSLAPGGGSAQNGAIDVIYTNGEIFVAEADQSQTHLSEGFIGVDLFMQMDLEDYQALEGVVVYPNPVKTLLTIQLPKDGIYEIKLFDMTGKLLKKTKAEFKMWSLQMKDLKPGYYLLNIIDQENKKYTNIKVQKI